jgi:hypothetical protein
VKTCGYIVTKGCELCSMLNVSGLSRGGILLPGKPVVFFTKPRDARRAISRSKRIAKQVAGSLIEPWARERCPQIFDESTGYAVVPVAKQ